MSFNFKKDLQRGLVGQQMFNKLFPKLVQTSGRSGDFEFNGDKFELKVDYYDLNKSPNFFIERYSKLDLFSPGGPWQADAHECKYFVYLYIGALEGYIFNTKDLIVQLEPIISNLKPVEVRNKSWITVGYKVPRGLLKPICRFNSKQIYEVQNAYENFVNSLQFKPTSR